MNSTLYIAYVLLNAHNHHYAETHLYLFYSQPCLGMFLLCRIYAIYFSFSLLFSL